MVRKRERKTTRGTTPCDTILKAVKAVKLDNFSIRRAALVFNINYRTLSRYCKKIPEGDLSENNTTPTISVGYAKSRQIFSNPQELTLILLSGYLGLTPKEIRILAYKVAHHNSIHIPESWIKNEMAGEDWFTGLMKRHSNLPIQNPRTINRTSLMNFKEFNCELFFNNLVQIMSRHHFTPEDILNMVKKNFQVSDRTETQKYLDVVTNLSTNKPHLEENKTNDKQQTTTEKNIEATTSLERHVSLLSETSDKDFKISNSENLHPFPTIGPRKISRKRKLETKKEHK